MEQKLKRESRPYIERIFKKYDGGTGAIHVKDMPRIMKQIVPGLNPDELQEQIEIYEIESSYLVPNKETHQFDVEHEPGTLDLPSVVAIVVHFLKKQERRNSNEFACRSLISLRDFPDPTEALVNSIIRNKRIF